ncbi:MAG TPA: flagellar assembly protein FliW [Negativicutes bacterium]|nr:flagellar assembly protein FliW [Negativicutes bacterium]
MVIKSKFFGEIEMDDNSLITFEDGIPGFPDLHKYVIIPDDENECLSYLQSLEQRNVCFIIMPSVFIDNSYDIEISEVTVNKLELEVPEDALIYTILNIPEHFKDTTANLKAPIIINSKNNRGIQEILDDERYSIRHRIVKESDV